MESASNHLFADALRKNLIPDEFDRPTGIILAKYRKTGYVPRESTSAHLHFRLRSENVLIQLAFPFGNGAGDCNVPGHIGGRSHHVQDSIKRKNEGDDHYGVLR